MTLQTRTTIFFLTYFLSVGLTLFSLGWMVILLGILLLPLLICHLLVGIRINRRDLYFTPAIIISMAAFLFFFLIRPDFGDTHAYSAWTTLLQLLGVRADNKLSDEGLPMLFAVCSYILVIVLDLFTLIKKPPSEFVD